ncbi:MAG: aspartyl protease family protein [Candidatus Eiseniibacteriota bacterium]|jgi:hypothetical protein
MHRILTLVLATVAVQLGGQAPAGAGERRLPARTHLEAPTRVEMDLSLGRPTLSVRIGESGPYTMVLDTGTPITLLDRSLADELGLENQGQEELRSPVAGGTPVPVDRVTLPAVTIGDARFEDVPALTWEQMRGLPGVRGVLSITVLGELGATLDFPAGNLLLHPDGFDAAQQARATSCRSDDQIIEADVVIGDVTVRGHIDTGSPDGVTLPGALAERLTFASPPVIVGQAGTIDATFEIRSAPLEGTVSVAGLEITNPVVTIAGPFPTVNIGTAALMDTRLSIDGRAQLLLLEGTLRSGPSRSAGRRVVTAGDGPRFGVALVPDPDGLRVREVMPGSRAERSGLEAGDLIAAIDSTAVADIPRGAMRATLTRAGAMLTVRRGEETLELRVR